MTVPGPGTGWDPARSSDAWVRARDLWTSTGSDQDADFYAELVDRLGRPAVELGVGTGRVAAHVGPEVGIDISSKALDRCASRLGSDARTALLHEDMADYSLDEPAQVSYAPLNTFNHLIDPEHRITAFNNVRTNTRPGGYLAFDLAMIDIETLRRYDRLVVEQARGDGWVLYLQTALLQHEPLTWHNTGVLEEYAPDGGSTRYHLPPMRQVYIPPDRVREELSETGWAIEAAWGSFDRRPLTSQSDRQIWLCVAR